MILNNLSMLWFVHNIFLDIPDHWFIVCVHQARVCSETWYETYDQSKRSASNAWLIIFYVKYLMKNSKIVII